VVTATTQDTLIRAAADDLVVPFEVHNSNRTTHAAATTTASFATAFPYSATADTSNTIADIPVVVTATTQVTVTQEAAEDAAVPTEVHDFTGNTQLVEDSYIVTSTRTTYTHTLTDFMLYLFTN